MKVFAHRGFSGRYPENTMLAFEKAVECNADGIELDVHLSKDGEVMIMHDEALKRTTGRPGIVSDYTRAELERIGVGKNEEGEWNEQPTIPSLEEYLEKSALLGIVIDSADDSGLVLAASIGSPDVLSDDYLPLLITVSRTGGISVKRDSRLDGGESDL